VRALLLLVVVSALVSTTFTHPALADARTEAAAKDAMKKAENDYLAMNYGSGAAKLQKALRACGANKCAAATRAAIQRDLGAMLFRKGDKEGAKKAWSAAGKLQPGLAMNPAYDSPDVRSAYETATGGAGGGSSAASGGNDGVPTNDLAHTPATEQRVNTPLPVYVSVGGDGVAQVVMKYKGPAMSDWRRFDLDKIGDGWGGLIPCSDVTAGTMRYYFQGFNGKKEAIANAGDAKHPYTVPIKNEIAGDEPRLPGMKPPKQCGKSADCPPDFPGCGNADSAERSKDGSQEREGTEAGDKGAEGGDSSASKRRRIWIGAAVALDFVHLSAGSDVCHLNRDTALPGNSPFYYCTAQNGLDFPTRNDGGNTNNNLLHPGSSGDVNDTIVPGDLRIMLAVDYAVTSNLLLGARIGFDLFSYPGGSPTVPNGDSINAAVRDARASGLGRLHLEARGTWVFKNEPFATTGIAPIAFLGGGVSQFDGHTSGTATVFYPTGPVSGKVNIWKTGGPGFFLLGGGLRWALTERVAATLALRANLAVGGSGLLPTVGPEFGAQLGF
jgi:hypothetical protein